MFEYERIDISEMIDVNKTNLSIVTLSCTDVCRKLW